MGTNDRGEPLRHVRFGRGYTLRTWETGRRMDTGQSLLAYEMRTPEGTVLFAGDDFGCSPLRAIDSDATLRGLLGFLTLRPGDTDAEYFATYSAEQRAFSESSECEAMQWEWAWDTWETEYGEPPAFEEIDPASGPGLAKAGATKTAPLKRGVR